MSSIFQSARLNYCAARPGDMDELYVLYNDPEVQVGVFSGPIKPQQAGLKDLLEKWVKENAMFVMVVEKETDELVGSASLWDSGQTREYMFGIQIKRKFWGKGFGKEIVAWTVQHAFKMMGIHRISLGVFESNPRAYAVYKAAGFVQEGVKRKARFIHGRWEDVILMGILDEEFFARDAAQNEKNKNAQESEKTSVS